MIVFHGTGDEAGGGVRTPVVDGDGGEVAEGRRPVIGELGAEPHEAVVGHFAALRRAPDRVEGVWRRADDRSSVA